jgi:hypothetical protein
MTVLDRVNRHRAGQPTRALTAGESPDSGPSSTLVVDSRHSEVATRLHAVMTTMNNFIIQNDDTGLAKFAFLLQALTDEVIEELEERDEATLAGFLAQMGDVIAWIGHGDNSRLPENFQLFAEELSPSLSTSPT